MSNKSQSPKTNTTMDMLPPKVLQHIASLSRLNTQGKMRLVSKTVHDSIANPFEKEQTQINKLVKVFANGQLQPYKAATKNTAEDGTYGFIAWDTDTNLMWDVKLTYTNKVFTNWNELTVCLFRVDTREMVGAIRMEFNARRLSSYKAEDISRTFQMGLNSLLCSFS